MAHEVGHLLLGGGYHGRAGVMRAEWPDATLTREGADWRFSVSEAARMHLTLTSLATETHLPAGGSDKVVALSAPNTTR